MEVHMPERTPSETTNLDRYGDPELPWSRARDHLASQPAQPATTFFLATAGAGGSPNVAGIGIHWYDGDLFFTCGPGTRKARNLASDPACVIAVALGGIDLVLEGEAIQVHEPDLVETVIAIFRASGWPAEVRDGRVVAPYSAPSAGPPPWDLYRFTFHTVFGVATETPGGATRWRFG
jgi:hypothetical protein